MGVGCGHAGCSHIRTCHEPEGSRNTILVQGNCIPRAYLCSRGPNRGIACSQSNAGPLVVSIDRTRRTFPALHEECYRFPHHHRRSMLVSRLSVHLSIADPSLSFRSEQHGQSRNTIVLVGGYLCFRRVPQRGA